jgi:hypothetical protein
MAEIYAEYDGSYFTPEQIDELHAALEADIAHMAADDPEADAEAELEADLGHDYDGPELHAGTPEYEAERGEYEAWAADPQPEPEAEPEPEAGL